MVLESTCQIHHASQEKPAEPSPCPCLTSSLLPFPPDLPYFLIVTKVTDRKNKLDISSGSQSTQPILLGVGERHSGVHGLGTVAAGTSASAYSHHGEREWLESGQVINLQGYTQVQPPKGPTLPKTMPPSKVKMNNRPWRTFQFQTLALPSLPPFPPVF